MNNQTEKSFDSLIKKIKLLDISNVRFLVEFFDPYHQDLGYCLRLWIYTNSKDIGCYGRHSAELTIYDPIDKFYFVRSPLVNLFKSDLESFRKIFNIIEHLELKEKL